MLFILFWVNFWGYILGARGNKRNKTAQTENLINEESRLRAGVKDMKYWSRILEQQVFYGAGI